VTKRLKSLKQTFYIIARIKGDLRNFNDLANVFNQKEKFDLILHMAAQVAVTTSVTNPRDDFEINAIGTFNLLEAVRLYNPEAVLIYASTNKVYGEMESLKIALENGRYTYKDLANGVDENRNLENSLLTCLIPFYCKPSIFNNQSKSLSKK